MFVPAWAAPSVDGLEARLPLARCVVASFATCPGRLVLVKGMPDGVGAEAWGIFTTFSGMVGGLRCRVGGGTGGVVALPRRHPGGLFGF